MRHVECATRSASLLLLAAASLLPIAAAAGEHPLLGGRRAIFRASASPKGFVHFGGDTSLVSLPDPRCPAASAVRLYWSVEQGQTITLPCANWVKTAQGYGYVDRSGSAGGVQRVILTQNDLVVRFRGTGLQLPSGAASFVEVALTVGDESVCGRFPTLVHPALGLATATGPSQPCLLPRPNFIVVILDDARADGLDGMPVLQSRLVGGGTTFPDAFTPFAVCCPSRASTLTGLYAVRHGTRHVAGAIGGADTFRESGADQQTLAVWLHDAGYRTGLFGKYLNDYAQTEAHQGPGGSFYRPPGWDRWWAFVSPEHYGGVNGTGYTIVDEAGALTSYADHSSDAEYSTDLSAAALRAFVAQSVSEGAPFFAYWAPYAPHGETPNLLPEPAQRHSGLFASLPLWRPPSWNEADVTDKPLWVQSIQLAFSGVYGDFIRALNDATRQRQYETLLAVDEQLGAILDQLSDLGVDRDTLILFTSDNGLGWGEHHVYSGKECAYDECIRVPFLVRYPRRVGMRSVGATALNIDIAPTIASFAGVEVPIVTDGESLRGFLTGAPPPQWRTDFLLERWRAERRARVSYSAQVADGDRVRLYYGDPRAKPRPSVVFEFDGDDRVASDAVAVRIGSDEDVTFASLQEAVLTNIPGVQANLDTAQSRLIVVPGPPVEMSAFFWEEVDQNGAITGDTLMPDYLGLRNVAQGLTYVEYETEERELYDLGADPDQLENKVDEPGYQNLRTALAGRLARLLAEIESR